MPRATYKIAVSTFSSIYDVAVATFAFIESGIVARIYAKLIATKRIARNALSFTKNTFAESITV
ncbi:hypothetical protein C4552_03240 [Candidatus Parcubacteria bacterium]|nr:MAG: hypothetical protein C4552_03240 [Candidatus Parcubacteria bacterium]